MLPSRDTPQTDRQIHLLSPTLATVSRALQMRVNSDFFDTTENFLKTPQPQVFVQNANSTGCPFSTVFLAVQRRNCLPVGERVLFPSLLLSLSTADSASELNRDCVRTNDERASERSVGLWRGRKKTTASPPPPPRKRRASSRSCSARARVKVPIRPSVRVRCFSTASSIATVSTMSAPRDGKEGMIIPSWANKVGVNKANWQPVNRRK